jgi:hypothetical protein
LRQTKSVYYTLDFKRKKISEISKGVLGNCREVEEKVAKVIHIPTHKKGFFKSESLY